MNNIAGRLEKETQFYEKMKEKLKGMPKIIGEYCTSMRANRKSYTTVNVYINNVLHFARFVCDGEIAEDFYKHITQSDVENYMISLETKETSSGIKRMGDDILQSRWSSLNTFFDWCLKRGYIDKNPMGIVNRPKNNTEHKVTYLTKAEINKLFKAIDRNENEIFKMRDKTIIGLALATALRVSALVNINVDDIDFDNSVIKVVEKRQKVREIPMGENTMNMLREYVEFRSRAYDGVDSLALFLTKNHNRLSVWDANDMLEKYCDWAGIKRVTFHKIRASSACALAKAGVPVKAIAQQLGHSGIGVTMRYLDVFNEDREKTKGVLDNLF
jgi:site-specific recombinase XerD